MTSYFQDGSHDVISPQKVLPPGEWTRSIFLHLCSTVRQFLIYSSFALVRVPNCRRGTTTSALGELDAST